MFSISLKHITDRTLEGLRANYKQYAFATTSVAVSTMLKYPLSTSKLTLASMWSYSGSCFEYASQTIPKVAMALPNIIGKCASHFVKETCNGNPLYILATTCIAGGLYYSYKKDVPKPLTTKDKDRLIKRLNRYLDFWKNLAPLKGSYDKKEKLKYRPEIYQAASAMSLSSLAYQLSNDIMVEDFNINEPVVSLENNNTWISYRVLPLQTQNPHFNAFLLLSKEHGAKLIFQGTNSDEKGSIYINFESGGAGYQTYLKERNAIMYQVTHAINSYFTLGQKISLDIAGHSQGGAFAQLFTNAVLETRATTTDLDIIGEVNVKAINSPGVPLSVAKNSSYYAKKLYQEIDINAIFGIVDRDIISNLGRSTIFAEIDPKYAKVILVRVDKMLEDLQDHPSLKDGFHFSDIYPIIRDAIFANNTAHKNINFSAELNDRNNVKPYGEVRVKHSYSIYRNYKKDEIKELGQHLNYKAYIFDLISNLPRYIVHSLFNHNHNDKKAKLHERADAQLPRLA